MKHSLFVLAAVFFLLNLASTGLASDNGSLKQPGGWLQDEQEHTHSYQYSPVIDEPSINSPTLETVWEHGQTRVLIRWDGLEGNLVKGSLLKNGTSVSNLLDWQENRESASIPEVLSSWGSGSGFQIRLEDNLGNFLLSDEFRIMAPINITEPTFGTTWAHSQTGVPIRWSGAPGSTVTIELLNSGNRVATLAESIPNTGEYIYSQPIPQNWEVGGQYSVKITDSIGNVYNSHIFSVNSIYIYSPSSNTVWSDDDDSVDVAWIGGSRVVSIDLYNSSSKIMDMVEYTDNTGCYSTSSEFLSTLSPGTNYCIHVRDDQGNHSMSDEFRIAISPEHRSGAVRVYNTREVEGVLPDSLERKWFDLGMQQMGYYSFITQTNASISLFCDDRLVLFSNTASDTLLHFPSIGRFYVCAETNDGINQYRFGLNKVDLGFTPRIQFEPAILGRTDFVSGEAGYGFRINYRFHQLWDIGFDICSIPQRGHEYHYDGNFIDNYEFPAYKTYSLMIGRVLGNSSPSHYLNSMKAFSVGLSLQHNSVTETSDLDSLATIHLDRMNEFDPGIFFRMYSWCSSENPSLGWSFMIEFFPLSHTLEIENLLVTVGASFVIGKLDYF